MKAEIPELLSDLPSSPEDTSITPPSQRMPRLPPEDIYLLVVPANASCSFSMCSQQEPEVEPEMRKEGTRTANIVEAGSRSIKLHRKGKTCKRDAEGRLDNIVAVDVTVEDTFLGISG
jgi:hypothetical protein